MTKIHHFKSLTGLACAAWSKQIQHAQKFQSHESENMYRKNILYKHESVVPTLQKWLKAWRLNPFFFNYETVNRKPWKWESICEITCSVISLYGCYYITLLLINTSSYLLLFLPEEQNVLEMHPFLMHPTLCCRFWRCYWQRQGLIMGCFKPRMHQD